MKKVLHKDLIVHQKYFKGIKQTGLSRDGLVIIRLFEVKHGQMRVKREEYRIHLNKFNLIKNQIRVTESFLRK